MGAARRFLENARRQGGFTLVETMVSLVIGLLVVAAAIGLLVNRIREHRALLVESRLLQDLRTSADLVMRDLRRAGYWGDAVAGIRHTAAGEVSNPYLALAPTAGASDAVSFRYSRDATENHILDDNEKFGFRLRDGVIQMLIGDGSWQAMTDAGTMTVTSFVVTPIVREISLDGSCAKACAPGAVDCPPRQQVRSLAVAITGRSTADSKVVRSVRGQVRLRNDAVIGACPA